MADGQEWDIDALRAAARADYAARLPLRIEQIERLAAEGHWVEARREIHKLRGSAATYGFEDIGAAAALLEDLLLAADGAPDSDARLRFDQALRGARSQADRAAREGL
jgi:HPt (histidine-containing phosphotransfer) domain-containing protein